MMDMNINLIMLGAATMASLTISVFFLKFWKTTHDRFFLFFSVAFFIESLSRIMLGILNYADEYEPWLYSVRLLSFLMILFAIIDKNWRKSKDP